MHFYKSTLLGNLTRHYDRPDWRTVTFFKPPREEILFVVPAHENIERIINDLFTVLEKLPEIDHPRERVVIGFCYEDGSGYKTKLINPSKQDEINLALIGYTPKVGFPV